MAAAGKSSLQGVPSAAILLKPFGERVHFAKVHSNAKRPITDEGHYMDTVHTRLRGIGAYFRERHHVRNSLYTDIVRVLTWFRVRQDSWYLLYGPRIVEAAAAEFVVSQSIFLTCKMKRKKLVYCEIWEYGLS